jgi:hypothetical protein
MKKFYFNRYFLKSPITAKFHQKMSHKEDQLMEAEALESIFPNEIEGSLVFSPSFYILI